MTDELAALHEIRDLLKNSVLTHPLRVDNSEPNVTYEGYSREIFNNDDSKAWFILKKVTKDGVTSTLFAYTNENSDDGGKYNKRWTGRDLYIFF